MELVGLELENIAYDREACLKVEGVDVEELVLFFADLFAEFLFILDAEDHVRSAHGLEGLLEFAAEIETRLHNQNLAKQMKALFLNVFTMRLMPKRIEPKQPPGLFAKFTRLSSHPQTLRFAESFGSCQN